MIVSHFFLVFSTSILAGYLGYLVRHNFTPFQPNPWVLLPFSINLLVVHLGCFGFLVKRPRHLLENTFVVTFLALTTTFAISVVFVLILRQHYSFAFLGPFIVTFWAWAFAIEHGNRKAFFGFRYTLIDTGPWRHAAFPRINLTRVSDPSQLDFVYDVLLVDRQVRSHPDWHRFLRVSPLDQKQIIDAGNFYELVSGQVWPDNFLPSDLVIDQTSVYRDLIKRSIDLGVSIIALIAFLPAFAIIAALVFFSSPGGVFFRQTRVGLNGATFTLFKIRTMFFDSEPTGPQFAEKLDSRVTYIGRFLRRSRLDEWPQFWNVLRGEMSIVGPRPERPEWVREFKNHIPYYEMRNMVRPGITGWAQVTTGYAVGKEGAETKLNLDLYYIKQLGFSLDLIVFYRTLATLIKGSGAR